MSLTANPTPEMAAVPTVSLINFKTSQGVAQQATVLRLLPQAVSFEVYSPQCALQTSETLTDFKIMADDLAVYRGRAVVTSVVNKAGVTLCEAALSGSLLDLGLFQPGQLDTKAVSSYQIERAHV